MRTVSDSWSDINMISKLWSFISVAVFFCEKIKLCVERSDFSRNDAEQNYGAEVCLLLQQQNHYRSMRE